MQSARRLRFKLPLHAALRAFIFKRDLYRCVRCCAEAADVPANYTGRNALWTNRVHRDGSRVLMVVDHVVTLKAGGRNVAENLQSLCELCNLEKMPEDREASAAYGGLC